MQQKQSISINIEDINKTAKEHVANNNIQFEKKNLKNLQKTIKKRKGKRKRIKRILNKKSVMKIH